jgi:hypothetical protein
MRSFVETHWGDLVALLVLSAGIVLVAFGPHEKAQQLGEALSAAALIGLRLRATSPPGGANGERKNSARTSPSEGNRTAETPSKREAVPESTP